MYKVIKTENGKFSVKKDGAKRASKVFDNEKEANEYASTMNSKENSNQTGDKVNDKVNDNVKSEKSQTVTTTKSRTNKKSSKTSNKKGLKKIWAWLLGILGIGAVGATATVAVVNNTGGNDGITLSEGIVYDDFQIHFMTLGNDKAGDSVYIKAGDTDILIDAGSRSGSSNVTIPYMEKYVKDKKLEYVIATHGDQDHIDAFPNILKKFDAETIITNNFTVKATGSYNKMLEAFNDQVENKGAKWYYAGDCYNNTNGAHRSYQLSDKVTMNILYNKYYYEKGFTSSTAPSGWENNYSVCTLFTYTNNGEVKNFLLTGDLEKEGEEALAEYYDGSTAEKTLPKVDMFKAGHHGSKTSSNDCLLDIIQPKMCVVSCCCGTDEYTRNIDNQFPTQQFINRIAKWTDAVYVTTIYDSYEILKDESTNKDYVHSTGFKEMNGNICVSVGLKTDETTSTKSVEIGLACSNNTIKLKDSEWMNLEVTIDGVKTHFRTMPEQWKKNEVKTNDTN